MGMDKFLGAFSLQNFLRQFFCGVVFFVPFFLYDSYIELNRWLVSGTPKAVCLGALACVIGTIIYHFEKNLYSYATQIAFESMARRRERWGKKFYFYTCSLICMAYPILYILSDIVGRTFDLKSATATIASLVLTSCGVFAMYFAAKGYHIGVIKRTEDLWKLEVSKRQTRHVCSKIDNWASFIHCAQSCCFAWLLGCAIVESTTCACCCGCPCCAEQIPSCHAPYVLIILAFEALFDWHRYQHVLSITGNNNK